MEREEEGAVDGEDGEVEERVVDGEVEEGMVDGKGGREVVDGEGGGEGGWGGWKRGVVDGVGEGRHCGWGGRG